MAPVNTHARSSAPVDELDDILNGILEGRDVPQSDSDNGQSNRKSNTTGALGVDEEITITKKRLPIPKLDDERLLSDAGIPRLQKISKDRLRFKGKGHEYGDIARMLTMYQFWLDDLHPRAKFADALAIIEKVGHKKRMQMIRKDWIDDGKPRRNAEQDDEDVEETIPVVAGAQEGAQKMDGVEKPSTPAAPELGSTRQDAISPSHNRAESEAGDDPDEDELDALLAESAEPNTRTSMTLPSRPTATEDDPFAEEMEAMDGMW